MIFDKRELLTCLEVIEKALPVRSPVSVINNIFLNCQEEKVLFSATNLELEIKYTLPHPGQNKFKVLLPPRIVDIIRYLPDQQVKISCDLERHGINITSGPASYSLYGADAAEYPVSSLSTEESTYVDISQARLKQALRQVVFASSNEEGRPVFTGLLFTFDETGVTITGSDTYRVALLKMSVSGILSTPQQVLIPARTIRELVKILNDVEQTVRIGFHKNQVSFDFQQVNVVAKVLDEKFPDITGIIPSDYKTRVQLPREQFEETVTRASLLAEGINRAVCLSLNGSNLQVSTSSQVGKMEEGQAVEAEGEDFKIYLNSRFLLEMMRAVDYKLFRAEFNGTNGPVIFRPGEEEEENYLYLVLPIKMTS